MEGWEENPFPLASILAVFICPIQQKRNWKGKREADTAVIVAEKVGIHTTDFLQFKIYFCEPGPIKYMQMMFNLGKGSAPESAWHCCAMAGLPGALNPQSSCRTQLWVPRLGHSLGRRTFGVAKPGSPGRTFGVTMPGSPGRTFGVPKPGSPGSSGPVWVRQCLRCLGGSGSLAPLHSEVTHSSKLDA